jgi:Zinc-binding dehydrogenase
MEVVAGRQACHSINVMRARHPAWFREDLERLFALLATGTIRPRVAERISFDEVAEAHRRLEAGGLEVKLVLCPDLPSRRDRMPPQRKPGSGSVHATPVASIARSDVRAGVRPRLSPERSYIIGGDSGGAVENTPVAFEHLGTERRQHCTAAARRGSDHGFSEGLVDTVKQEPRALV